MTQMRPRHPGERAARLGAVLSAMLVACGAPALAETTVFVVAGTKSMSGALEGRAKLEVVREAMGWSLATRPANARVGIVTFGSRSANDCADVTIAAPPAAIRPADISANIGKITPKGRAPLADAMRIGGSFLPPGAPGTLVVFTDSADTCKGDPCAVAAELKAANAGLKIDIIALGVKPADQAKLVCAAAATGGAFTAAATPGDVIAALAVAPPAATAPPTPPTTPVAAAPSVDVKAPSDDIATKDGVSVRFPASVEAGSYGVIEFVGPNAPDDWVGIVDKNARSGAFFAHGSYAFTREGSPAKITAPAEPGSYEVRYVSKTTGVLVSKPLEVLPSTATIDAPESVPGGAPIEVSFKGPMGKANRITIAAPSDPDDKIDNVWSQETTFMPLSIRAPLEAGDYEIRYVLTVGKDTVIARKPMRVATAASAVLEPVKTKAGERVQINITQGPMHFNDSIFIARPNAPPKDYAGGSTGVNVRGKTMVTAPKEAGEWEIRYVINNRGNFVIIGKATMTVE